MMPATGKEKIPDGIVLPNGEHTVAADIAIEALPAYDLTPGDPPHPKGKANGYVITLGGKRILFAGVTQCVPELRAQKNIEVAFIPMNIPPDRMSPQEAADCVKALHPKIVYLSHYDQDYAARLTNPRATPRPLPSGLTVAQTVDAFRNAMKNSGDRIPGWCLVSEVTGTRDRRGQGLGDSHETRYLIVATVLLLTAGQLSLRRATSSPPAAIVRRLTCRRTNCRPTSIERSPGTSSTSKFALLTWGA